MLFVVAGICRQDNNVLLSQRPRGKHLAGTWEFPGGKVETGEPPEEALARELYEELGITVCSATPYTFAWHRYPERTVLLLFYEVSFSGVPSPREDNPCRWVPSAELDQIEIPAADQPLVAKLQADAGMTTCPGPPNGLP